MNRLGRIARQSMGRDIGAEYGLAPERVREVMDEVYARGDRLLRAFVLAHLALAFALAPFYNTWLMAAVVGAAAVAMVWIATKLAPRTFLSRCVAGIGLQCFVALHIYQFHGLPEMHFFFFTAFTMMIVYQDWLCMWPGAVLIIGQHVMFALLHNANAQVYFFPEEFVGWTKLFFHFGIALAHVALCGYWAHLQRRQTITEAARRDDLTASRRHLAEAKALLDSLFESAPIGLSIWDQSLRYKRVNKALAEMNGLPTEAHRGRLVGDLLPGVSQTVTQALEHVRQTGEVLSREVHGTTPAKPGELRAWAVSYYPVRIDGETVGVGAICEEITARQRAEEALRLARQRLDYVVEAVDMGLWFCDLPFGVLHWNAKAREHFGLDSSPSDITLDVFYGRIHPDDRQPVRAAVDRAIHQGEPYDVEFRTAPAASGEYRWLRAAGHVFRDADGQPRRFDGITLDITARRREQEQLLRSNEDLQQFAYAASHDMQEPLRTVASYVQLLQRRYAGKLDEQADEYIRYAVDGAKRMRSLIEDLLAYSRAGADHLPIRATDAHTILQQTLEALRASIQDSGAQITHDELPVVMADDAQFALLLQNLVSNAIKYRRPGVTPHIHIGAARRGGEWIFSVRDNGSGFDAIHAETVFAPFKRLHGREVAGTGIGLALCRRIVERHGGRIWAESRKGEGSTFYFTLPAVMEVHASVA